MHNKRMILSVCLFNQKSRPQVQDIPIKEENLCECKKLHLCGSTAHTVHHGLGRIK